MQEPQEASQQEPENKKHGKRFLAVYIIGLFSIALVLILLSYLTQVRAGEQLEDMRSQVNQQAAVAQGATQQMQTLQSTVEEQQKVIKQQQEEQKALQEALQISEEEQIMPALELLQDRYIALDALQQLRRFVDAQKLDDAKILAQKMIDNYGLDRLTAAIGEDCVLLGINSDEFEQIYHMLFDEAVEAGATTVAQE